MKKKRKNKLAVVIIEKIRQVEMKKIAIASITLSMFLLACAKSSNYRGHPSRKWRSLKRLWMVRLELTLLLK